MRKIIASINMSLDGFVEGPRGEMDWAMAEDEETWIRLFQMLDHVDTFVLGRVMYPAYEQHWLAVLADPSRASPISGSVPTENEIAFARIADETPHLVVSKALETVAWKTTRIVRDLDEIRALRERPGKDVYVVGGATLISSMLNAELIDELRLTVHPLLLGGGKALFGDLEARHELRLVDSKPWTSGKIELVYTTRT